jgi:hypothetical protein
MNEKEKKAFYIAMCKCCLIAEAMKTCPLCSFKIGLIEQEKSVDVQAITIPVPVEITLETFSTIQQVALNA